MSATVRRIWWRIWFWIGLGGALASGLALSVMPTAPVILWAYWTACVIGTVYGLYRFVFRGEHPARFLGITKMSRRFDTELALLYRVEAAHKIPAAPITRQLVEWERQSLPDAIPPAPRWIEFQWPASGTVDFNAYWRSVDREQRNARVEQWSGPYL